MFGEGEAETEGLGFEVVEALPPEDPPAVPAPGVCAPPPPPNAMIWFAPGEPIVVSLPEVDAFPPVPIPIA